MKSTKTRGSTEVVLVLYWLVKNFTIRLYLLGSFSNLDPRVDQVWRQHGQVYHPLHGEVSGQPLLLHLEHHLLLPQPRPVWSSASQSTHAVTQSIASLRRSPTEPAWLGQAPGGRRSSSFSRISGNTEFITLGRDILRTIETEGLDNQLLLLPEVGVLLPAHC